MATFAPWALLPLTLFVLQALQSVEALGLPRAQTDNQPGAAPNSPRSSWEIYPDDLVYLFHRPAEPVFSLRGINRRIAFNVPVSYLPERYKELAADILREARRNGARLITVPELAMPESRFADVNGILAYRGQFSRSPPNLKIIVRFWQFFHESQSVSELLAKAVWARLHFNPELILDALLLSMLRSPIQAVRNVQVPELTQYFPNFYIDDEFFAKAREEMHLVSEKKRNALPVVRNLTTDDDGALWYFREDPHFQVLHWKWHYIYPSGSDVREYVDLPRRGELFVHVHHQFMARHNAERFVNGRPATLPLDPHSPFPTAFFPKMINLHASKGLVGRQANSALSAVPGWVEAFDTQMAQYEQVLKEKSVLYANGTRVAIDGIEGLDIVSNLLEGNSVLSPNFDFYGNIHNSVHAVVGKSVDPLNEFKEQVQFLMFNTMVTKDPSFYNIHTLMDLVYDKYRNTLLKPYSKQELTPLPSVTLQSVKVRSEGTTRDDRLFTYFQESDLDVSLGMDYTPAGRQYARFTHLQHRAFDYVLQIYNNDWKTQKVFVRLFLLITQDETGAEVDFDFQRRNGMQMDTFEATLLPGDNTVRRASTDSALTLDTDAVYTPQVRAGDARRRNVCRCGWPQGLLLPRGTAAGTPYKVLAIVTDYEADRAPVSGKEECSDGWLLCGVPGSTHYPDARAMGFPLDRPFRSDVGSLQDFLTANMATADVHVIFEEETEGPTALLRGAASTSWMPTKRRAARSEPSS